MLKVGDKVVILDEDELRELNELSDDLDGYIVIDMLRVVDDMLSHCGETCEVKAVFTGASCYSSKWYSDPEYYEFELSDCGRRHFNQKMVVRESEYDLLKEGIHLDTLMAAAFA